VKLSRNGAIHLVNLADTGTLEFDPTIRPPESTLRRDSTRATSARIPQSITIDSTLARIGGFSGSTRSGDDIFPEAAGNRYGFKRQLGDLEAVVEALDIEKIVPVAHDAGGPAAINFAMDHPDRVASLCILNTFYAAAPSLRLPELIELFATPGLKALAEAILQSPEQLTWLLRFQQRKFLETLPEEHKASFESVLPPIINNNFNFGRAAGSGPAFAQMTAEVFEEVTRNTQRFAQMEALDIPVKLIWGGADLALDTGVADDFKAHFKHASLTVLPAGHWLQVDMPETVAREMLL
jgi:haloalkane dehalogenase